MKLKVVAVGEIGTVLLPLPESILKALGWVEGDDLELSISMVYPDTLLLYKVNKP